MGRKTYISASALLIFISILLLSATNDNKRKGFDVKALEKSLCYIPMGTYMFNDSSQLSDNKIKPKMISLSAFYMCNHVVTNEEYGVFLTDLKTADPSLYSIMLPDTLVWKHKSGFMDDLVKYYFRHPSYQDYPVVGVSHEQAEEYCKWLTQRYMKEPNRKFKNVVFRLPNLYQWEWAARGGLTESPFPWSGTYTVKYDKRYKGLIPLANYIHTPEQYIKRAGDTGKLEITDAGFMYGFGAASELNNAANITSPVLSYWPNGYGLYNMAGNVEEYVSEIGIAKGGSWFEPAYYLQVWVEDHYKNAQSVSDYCGFRVSMKVEN